MILSLCSFHHIRSMSEKDGKCGDSAGHTVDPSANEISEAKLAQQLVKQHGLTLWNMGEVTKGWCDNNEWNDGPHFKDGASSKVASELLKFCSVIV